VNARSQLRLAGSRLQENTGRFNAGIRLRYPDLGIAAATGGFSTALLAQSV
jgi:hypothetical protein